jgi:CheY-like chemotaxis protein
MKAARVLVIEDDLMIGALLGEMLTDMGHGVCAIETNEAGALTAALRCHPDLMIVDVRLGTGSGIRATDAILQGGAVPHVFVSGDISGVMANRPKAVAIQKPFRAAELARAIQRVLAAACPAGGVCPSAVAGGS